MRLRRREISTLALDGVSSQQIRAPVRERAIGRMNEPEEAGRFRPGRAEESKSFPMDIAGSSLGVSFLCYFPFPFSSFWGRRRRRRAIRRYLCRSGSRGRAARSSMCGSSWGDRVDGRGVFCDVVAGQQGGWIVKAGPGRVGRADARAEAQAEASGEGRTGARLRAAARRLASKSGERWRCPGGVRRMPPRCQQWQALW